MKRLRTGIRLALYGVVLFFALYGGISFYLDRTAKPAAVNLENVAGLVSDISAQQLCSYASFVNADFRGTLQSVCIVAPRPGSEPVFLLTFSLPSGSAVSSYYRLSDMRFIGISDGRMQFEVKATSHNQTF